MPYIDMRFTSRLRTGLLAGCLALLLWPSQGWGAVTVVGTNTIGSYSSGTTISFTHTVPAQATGLFIGVGLIGGATVTNVTWNGSSAGMEILFNAGSGNERSSGALITSPAVGTFTLVVTISVAVSGGRVAAVSLAGLNTATPHRTVYTNTGTTDPATVTVADSVSGDLVIDSNIMTQNTNIVVGASQTVQAEVDPIDGGSRSWGVSTESAAGSNTVMSWVSVNTDSWSTGATALVAASSATSSSIFFGVSP